MNFDDLQQTLEQQLPRIETVSGRDMYLFLGLSDAGKSTIITYLMGAEMQKGKVGGRGRQRVFPVSASADYPVLGHSQTAETLSPMAYQGRDGFFYCDCPGFLGNRGAEAAIVESVTTELAIKKSRSIKGFVLVINHYDLLSGNGERFYDLSKMLIRLFREDYAELSAYPVLFLISKAPDNYPVSQVIDEIQDQVDGVKKNLERAGRNHHIRQDETDLAELQAMSEDELGKIDEMEAVLHILDFIVSDPNNILVVNPLDGGVSRDMVSDRLRTISHQANIPKSIFNFSAYSKERQQFNDFLTHLASRGVEWLVNKQRFSKHIALAEDEIKRLTKLIRFYERKLAGNGVSEAAVLPQDQAPMILECEHRKQNLLRSIQEAENAIVGYERIIQQIDERYATYNTDELVLHDSQRQTEKRHKLGFFAYSHFVFEYGHKPNHPAYQEVIPLAAGVPIPEEVRRFSSEVPTDKDGNFAGFVLHYLNGEYKIVEQTADGRYLKLDYLSGYWQHGNVTFNVYIRKKDKPEIKMVMENLVSAKRNLENDIARSQRTIQSYREMIAEIERTIEQLHTSHSLGRQQALASVEEFRRRMQEAIEADEHDKIELAKVDQELAKHGKIFNDVRSIVQMMSIDLPFVGEFIQLLEWQELSDAKRNIPEEFLCPLSGELIFDPVIAECGDSFERQALEEYLESAGVGNKRQDCPCCSKSVDFSTVLPNVALKRAIDAWKRREASAADEFGGASGSGLHSSPVKQSPLSSPKMAPASPTAVAATASPVPPVPVAAVPIAPPPPPAPSIAVGRGAGRGALLAQIRESHTLKSVSSGATLFSGSSSQASGSSVPVAPPAPPAPVSPIPPAGGVGREAFLAQIRGPHQLRPRPENTHGRSISEGQATAVAQASSSSSLSSTPSLFQELMSRLAPRRRDVGHGSDSESDSEDEAVISAAASART